MPADPEVHFEGTIVAIRGGVVDVAFAEAVPRIHALIVAGGVAMEVASDRKSVV